MAYYKKGNKKLSRYLSMFVFQLIREHDVYYKSLVLGAIFVLLYYPILYYLVVNWWINPDYSHGFIVPLISAYIVWKKRNELLTLRPTPSILGMPLLITGILVLLLGYIGAELFLMRFSILLVISGLVLFLLGREYLYLLAFPIVFLIFMIPLPQIIFNAVAFPLQLFAAKLATDMINSLGIPVLREGNIIHLAYSSLEVAEACSGIRSMVSILTIASIYAYFFEGIKWKQVVILISALPIAIITNSTRVAGTGILAHHFSASTAEGFYHTFEGWFMFTVAFGLLLLVGVALSKFFR
jgi:exosortase